MEEADSKLELVVTAIDKAEEPESLIKLHQCSAGALEQLQADGNLIRAEDVARLSPLVFEHINLVGRYAFSVPDAVNRGELRPLRDQGEFH